MNKPLDIFTFEGFTILRDAVVSVGPVDISIVPEVGFEFVVGLTTGQEIIFTESTRADAEKSRKNFIDVWVWRKSPDNE